MHARTLFISDIHLGTRGCQARMLLDFLNACDAPTIYLVGDIVDGWRLRRGWHWPQPHNDVVEALLAKAHGGTRIFYIPGNHDEMMRAYLGTHFGGIEVMQTAVFTSLKGKRYLVTHGDQFDNIVVNAKWLAHVGDRAYHVALWLNTWVNKARKLWGGQFWSLSNWAKQQVKGAVNYISAYEDILIAEAQRGKYDGIICGHIHAAADRTINEIHYINCGDWVESCTAVIEKPNGSLEVVDWAKHVRQQERGQRARQRRAEEKETV